MCLVQCFNKATTMTFGYGKEINSFGKDMEETISLLSETDPSIGEAADATGMSRADLAKTLLNKYAAGYSKYYLMMLSRLVP